MQGRMGLVYRVLLMSNNMTGHWSNSVRARTVPGYEW